MGMADMEDMTGSTATTDVAAMDGTTSAAASSTSPTVYPVATSTPALLASPASGRIHNDEAAVSSSGANMDSMSGMSNVFHFGVGDTLWVTPLTPMTSHGYAGAIVLLVFMTLFLRGLTILRSMAEKHWSPKGSSRCNDGEDDNYLQMGQYRNDEAEDDSSHRPNIIQLIKALFQVTIMAMSYLLMLAVMTFNTGYLLAILVGGFLGELILGWIKH